MKCILCPRPLAPAEAVLVLGKYEAHALCALKLSLGGKVVRLRVAGGRAGKWAREKR
jgi:hypothetical protein